jgi:hypothetical protein
LRVLENDREVSQPVVCRQWIQPGGVLTLDASKETLPQKVSNEEQKRRAGLVRKAQEKYSLVKKEGLPAMLGPLTAADNFSFESQWRFADRTRDFIRKKKLAEWMLSDGSWESIGQYEQILTSRKIRIPVMKRWTTDAEFSRMRVQGSR